MTVCTLGAVGWNPSHTMQLVVQHIGCPDVGWAQALLLLHVGTKQALEKCTGFLTTAFSYPPIVTQPSKPISPHGAGAGHFWGAVVTQALLPIKEVALAAPNAVASILGHHEVIIRGVSAWRAPQVELCVLLFI